MTFFRFYDMILHVTIFIDNSFNKIKEIRILGGHDNVK